MAAFCSAPNEVIARILGCCDNFAQLLNLISTCKRLHSVWVASPGNIIWDVGKRHIVCFDDALMAVRATNIVKAAHEAERRPPDPFPIAALSGTLQKPSPQELNHVFGLHHMARCIKHTIFHWETRMTTELDFRREAIWKMDVDGRSFHEMEEGISPWHENLCRALYRFVLLGAVCSGAFNEPLFSAVETSATIAQDLVAKGPRYEKFSQTTLQYLEQYPAFSSNPAEYERVFKPFADWLVADGNKRHNDDSEATIREVIHILAVYYHMTEKIVNGDSHGNPGRYLGRNDFNNEGVRWNDGRGPIGYRSATRPPPPPSGFPGGIRKTAVVLFGVFQVEELSMPICVDDMTRRYLFADPSQDISSAPEASAGENTTSPTAFWDILSFLPSVGSYAPPNAIFHFFSFILQKYFKYRFTDEAFAEHNDPGSERPCPFQSFAWPVLFCDGEWGLGLVEQVEDP